MDPSLVRCIKVYTEVFIAPFRPRVPLAVYLCKAKSLLNIGDTEGLLDGGDGTVGVLVEELVDGSDTEAVLQHGNSLTNGLDGAGFSTLIKEAKAVLGESDTKGVLELLNRH